MIYKPGEKYEAIRKAHASGKPIGDIAIDFRVTRDHVKKIIKGWRKSPADLLLHSPSA